MDDAARMAEAQVQALGVFADATLKYALRLQQEAFELDDPDQRVRHAATFDRLGRGLRLTIAMQAKVARDARQEARDLARDEAQDAERRAAAEAAAAAAAEQVLEEGVELVEYEVVDEPDEPTDPTSVALRRRRDWLTRGVERCVWNEYDHEEEADEFTGESLLDDFREHLADLMADPEAFLALDPDTVLVDLCKGLGLNPPEFITPAPAVPKAIPPPGPPPDAPAPAAAPNSS